MDFAANRWCRDEARLPSLPEWSDLRRAYRGMEEETEALCDLRLHRQPN